MTVTLGPIEITGRNAARRRERAAATVRDELVDARRALRDAEHAVAEARRAETAAEDRAAALEDRVAALEVRAASDRPSDAAGDRPPAVGRELITVADRLVDLTGDGTPADTEQAAAALRWVRSRTSALLALCEIAPITDDGTLDFLRHEVVGDAPAPSPDLVDHIADTVRPGYQWRGDLVRAQQVIAYVPAPEPAHARDLES